MKLAHTLALTAALSLGVLSAQAAEPKPDSKTEGASSAGTSAAAGGVSRDLDQQFRKLDKDRDGFLSKQEAASDGVSGEDFDKHDKNHDGKLDEAEFQSLQADKAGDRSLGTK
jgi:hypothetical protein